MRVVVDTILSNSVVGVIFSGREVDGKRVIVRLAEKIFPAPGEVLEVNGELGVFTDARGRRHRQLTASKADRVRTSGRLLSPWLQSIQGIGQERAERLLDRFGNDLLDVLADASRIGEVGAALAPGRPATGHKLATMLMTSFVKRQVTEGTSVAEGVFYRQLEELGVSNRRSAKALYRLIGSRDAWSVLQRHPYAIGAVLPWPSADHLALRLLATRGELDPEHHSDRYIAACDAVWRLVLETGNTSVTRPEFLKRLARCKVNASEALKAGIDAKRVIFDEDLLRPPGAAWLERKVAAEIERIRHGEDVFGDNVAAREITEHTRGLHDEQRYAVEEILVRRFAILQGYAGTGKTTTMRALVSAHESRGGRTVLATISGKAALRLSRSTGRLATTIARLLGGLARRHLMEERGQKCPDDLPKLDRNCLVIIDEASMVDLVSWSKLLPEVPSGACLVMVGDVAQLPPVGLGQVYHDLVGSAADVLRLTKIHRQGEGSEIVRAASEVRQGHAPKPSSYRGVGPGLSLLECQPNEHLAALQRLRSDLDKAGVPIEDVLVLAGLRKTCSAINEAMQFLRLRAGAAGVRLGPLAGFASLGDPVICTRNRYDESIMNGLMGWVASVAPVLVHLDGEAAPRELSADALVELQSAWAITCHRAQGSEARVVIVILDGSTIATREWLYTAITRATEQVVLVGARSDLEQSVARHTVRKTGFGLDLAQLCEKAAGECVRPWPSPRVG